MRLTVRLLTLLGARVATVQPPADLPEFSPTLAARRKFREFHEGNYLASTRTPPLDGSHARLILTV